MSPEPTRGAAARSGLGPDLIAQRGFMVVRRGFDQDEVRAFLDQVAAEVRVLRARIDELASAPAAAAAEPAAVASVEAAVPTERPPLDEDEVVALVGEETAAVLRAARAAAVDLRRRAETEAERIVGDARESTSSMRREAEAILAGASAEAEAAAEQLRTAAEAEAEAVRSAAASEAERLRSTAAAEAEGIVTRARAEADGVREQAEQQRRLTVDGAQAMREKILGDLSRRRRIATVQIEQLRAGRERLLESYAVVRRTLEEVHDELQRADAEARSAADDAGRRAEQDAGAEAATEAGVGAALVPPGDASPSAAAPAPGAGAAVDDDLPAVVEEEGLPSPAAVDAPTDAVPTTDADSAGADTVASGDTSVTDTVETPIVAGDAPAGGSGTGHGAAGGTSPSGVASGSDAGAGPVVAVGAAGAVVAGAEPFERVRVIRGEAPARARADGPRSGPPSLRAVAGGRVAVGGGQPVEIVEDQPDTDATGDLFARMRAQRAASVAAARQVLADGEDPANAAVAADVGLPADAASPADTASLADTSVPAGQGDEAGEYADGPEVSDGPEGSDGVEGSDGPEGSGSSEGLDLPEGAERRSDEDEALLQQRDRLTNGIEATLVKRLKRLLQDEQNELLDRLRHSGPSSDPAVLLHDGEAQRTSVVDTVTPILAGAAVAGASLIGSSSPPPAGLVDAVAADLAEALVAPLRRRLTDAVRDAGGEQATLVEAIGAAYRECKTQRVEPMVVDAVVAAFASGTFTAVPAGASLRWVVEDVAGPCADCDDNSLAGAQPKGEPWPTGQLHPPAHPGCRCMLVLAPA